MDCLTTILNDAIPAAAGAARVVPVLTNLMNVIGFAFAGLGLHRAEGFWASGSTERLGR